MVGDVVVGEITSVQDSGIAVNLLSFHSKKSRDFTDLDISVGKSYYPILFLLLDARFCKLIFMILGVLWSALHSQTLSERSSDDRLRSERLHPR